ncbi:MAG: uncharacterized protein QOC71_2025 [Thermoplasmata archaeon]|jgi:hypothetical protein|nr:uncharacterized protein [Thermoplasmata archaeon]
MSPPPPPTGTVAQQLVAAAPAIHLISHETVEKMGTEEKIRFILDEVEAGKVLVLERGLTPHEEAKLIEQTMREIDPDHFIGIEMQSYGMDRGKNLLQRVAMGGPRPRMAVIGPASLLKLISKDNQKIVTQIIGQDKDAKAAGA